MAIQTILKTLGGFLVALGFILLVPGIFAFFAEEREMYTFFLCSLLTAGTGCVLWISLRNYKPKLDHRAGFAVVTISWCLACVVGALPYYLSGVLPSFVDALFESTSGFTGTGSSVITQVESVSDSLLLWRSLTQWVGGMGIIVFFLAILPFLGLGVVQLFRAEVSGPTKDQISPRVRDTAKKLWMLYIGFTSLLAILLIKIGGMSDFDALNHAFTALATGGFSTKNAGIAYFHNPAVDYLLCIFMVIGAVNFGLQYRLLVEGRIRVLCDTELKWYLGILAAATLVVFGANYASGEYISIEETFRNSLFVVVANGTSTGFSNADYTLWAPCSQFVIGLVMIVGSMAGSTGGGIKCIRLVAAVKQVFNELKLVVHPHAVTAVKTSDEAIHPRTMSAIWGVIFLYFVTLIIASLIITFMGVDIVTAVSAVISDLSGVGPALGKLGPAANYAWLPNGAKIVLSLCMILGRLEFLTVMVLFSPVYWKK